jgi:hypothetical protein
MNESNLCRQNPGRPPWTTNLAKNLLTTNNHSEREIARACLENFQIEGSEAQRFLWELTEQKMLMQESIREIAEMLSLISDIPLSRIFKRTRLLTMKWIEDNIDELRMFKSLFLSFDFVKSPPPIRDRKRHHSESE